MGIDIHGLKFLKYAGKSGEFGDTVMVGRQGVHVPEDKARKILGAGPDYTNDDYAERLLTDYFGARTVSSVDNSDYQQAAVIQDMNLPLAEAHYGKFDTVIDGGTLEHIFNVPQALKNCSLLCRPGGQILHILPANNSCGHGFWQFSPELFFSLYSPENGYAQTDVFIADLADTSVWYKVKKPENGNRVNVISSTELYALVRTVRSGETFRHENVQQSDYLFDWERAGEDAATAPPPIRFSGLKTALKKAPAIRKALASANNAYRERRAARRFLAESQLDARNPGLTVCALDAML